MDEEEKQGNAALMSLFKRFCLFEFSDDDERHVGVENGDFCL